MKQYKKDFPLLNARDIRYLDNAATTQKPQAVIDAITNFYTTTNANVGRGIYQLQEASTQAYEDARTKVANFIGASHDEIIFTKNATDSINCVAATWGYEHIREGDEIVISELEHHANLLPWQRLANQKGAILKYIPVRADGTLDYDVLGSIITPATKLVAIVHTSNALGTRNDIVRIIAQARLVGAKVLVDAAQSVAHESLNVQELQPDFLVFSGHKMMGPTGIGVLYIARALHKDFPAYQLGGGMVERVNFQTASLRAMPYRLEAGTPPIAEAVGLAAAIDYIKEHIDYAVLQRHEALLVATLIDALVTMPRIRLLGPISQLRMHGHMLSFTVEGMHAHDVAAYLDMVGICVRAGHHCAQPLANKLNYEASVRISFYCYNTLEDVHALIHALTQMVQAMPY